MTKDEYAKYIRNVRYVTLFSADLFVGECVAALVWNNRTWLYVALIPLVATALGLIILRSSKEDEDE